jgi:nucleoid-associated protein YgaU
MYAAGRAIKPVRPPKTARLRGLGRWLLVAVMMLAVSVALARVAAGGTAPVGRVVVQPGDTLWSIAAARYPGDDPRERVDAIERLNGLSGPGIEAGETLLLPPGD